MAQVRQDWRSASSPAAHESDHCAGTARAVYATGYLSRRDRRRSASGLPPVWQVGQYCSEESANETSLIVSPHTAHSWPARPCTRRPLFFSPFRSAAARPAERSTASVSVVLIASYRVATSSGVMLAAILKGDILAACSTSSE